MSTTGFCTFDLQKAAKWQNILLQTVGVVLFLGAMIFCLVNFIRFKKLIGARPAVLLFYCCGVVNLLSRAVQFSLAGFVHAAD